MTEICLFLEGVCMCKSLSIFPQDQFQTDLVNRASCGIRESGKVKTVDERTWILLNVDVISILQANTNKSNRRTQNFHLFRIFIGKFSKFLFPNFLNSWLGKRPCRFFVGRRPNLNGLGKCSNENDCMQGRTLQIKKVWY